MIILIEPNKSLQKILGELLHHERIITINSSQQALEMLCKYQRKVDVIVADINLLNEMVADKMIYKLCDKLAIKTPPMIAIYRSSDTRIKEQLEKKAKKCIFLAFGEKDHAFPEHYIETLRKVYPGVRTDLEGAKEAWRRKEDADDLVDLRKWMMEEGLLDKNDIAPTEEKSGSKKQEKDYKKMYFEIKKKYDELLKYMNDLIDSV